MAKKFKDNTIVRSITGNYYRVNNGELTPVKNYNGIYKDNDGKTYVSLKFTKPTRIKENTSRTAKGKYDTGSEWKNTTEYEDAVNDLLYAKNNNGENIYGDPNWKYATPFIENKAIKVNGNIISENQLDSIAKYAGQAQVPLEEAIGLSFESVHGTQPEFNQSSAAKLAGMKFTDKQAKERDNVMANANYMRNYGIIPSQYLFRDWEYNIGGYNNGIPYNRNMSPYLHAFDFYDRGLYNPNNKNHTEHVKKIGKQIFNENNVQEWYNRSGKRFYNQPTTNSNRKYLEELEGIYPKKYARKHKVK